MLTLSDMGQELRKARKSVRLTQQQLAERTGTYQEALSRFESGRGNDFSLAKLLRLANALGYELKLTPLERKRTLHDVLEERRTGTNVGPDSR